MLFIAAILNIFIILNKATFSRRRFKLFTSRILQERFLNDLLANLREAHISVNFFNFSLRNLLSFDLKHSSDSY